MNTKAITVLVNLITAIIFSVSVCLAVDNQHYGFAAGIFTYFLFVLNGMLRNK
jgi:hypothetical protein